MASLREVRCRGCGLHMLVHPDVGAFRCLACRTIIQLRVVKALAGYNNDPSNSNNNKAGYRGPAQPNRPPQETAALQLQRVTPPRQPAAPPSDFGRKRGVLCGVNYRGKRYSLNGSINDVKSMSSFLVQQMGFPVDTILLLTEDEPNPERIPTKKNMKRAMRWLVHGSKPGDSLVFHFSGHGLQLPDNNGDEQDGCDEALCPLDHETEGMILDDEINATMVLPLPSGVRLHAIIDACHSGTVLDLPFVCKLNKKANHNWENHTTHAYKGTSGGVAFCFSACDDDKKSCEASVFTGDNTGALTYSFLKVAKAEAGLTYGQFLKRMHFILHEAKSTSGIGRDLSAANIALEPQLSCSEQFDVYSRKFVL